MNYKSMIYTKGKRDDCKVKKHYREILAQKVEQYSIYEVRGEQRGNRWTFYGK